MTDRGASIRRSISILFFLFQGLQTALSDGNTQFVATSWGLREGLPQSSVNHIIQSKDGYLWLATFGGLVRFNGETFTTFSRTTAKGIRSDRVLNLYEDHAGNIWCSTEAGFSRFSNGVFTTFTIVDDTHSYSPLFIAEDSRNALWISAHAKPYRFNGSAFVPVTVLHDPALAKRAVEDPSGIWLAHEREVLRTLGDSIVQVADLSTSIATNIQNVVEHPRGSGVLWFATSGDGVFRLKNGALRNFTVADGLPSIFMQRLYVDRNGNLFATGFLGISRLQEERFIPVRTVAGDFDEEFNAITQDNEGSYWIGSPSKGLRRLRLSPVRMIGPADGLKEGKMLSLMRKKDGTFLFGTNCGGVYEWDGVRAKHSALNARLVNLCVWSLFEDSREQLWVGSRILTRFDQSRRERVIFDSAKGFYGIDVFAITEDSKKNIWIGCLNGLFFYDGRTFRQYSRQNGLTGVDVRSLYEDRNGTMWIGTTNGLFTMNGWTLSAVPLRLQHGPDTVALSSYIRAIYQDRDGAMWFGTYGGGLLRLKDGRMSAITTANGLFDDIVSHLWEDENGYFWSGSNRGVSRFHRNDLNAVADGNSSTLRQTVFGTSDGMWSPETNGGFQPSIAVDGQGHILFPTVDGVAMFDTKDVTPNTVVPPVHIENVIVDGRPVDVSSEIVLPYDSADIEIHYSSLSFIDRAKIKYRYSFTEGDGPWVNAGSRSKAYFTNIQPGTWTFRVVGSNNDGVWNEQGTSIRITVTPPWWMTWWFRSLIGLFFLVSGPSVYYLRVTQLEKEKKAQLQFAEQLIESQEQERRRIAADLHDGLGQQILIIKNRVEMALNSVHDPAATAEQLREIAESARSSINDVRTISHGLRPVHLEQFGLRETLLHLVEQVQQSSPIEWVSHVDEIDGFLLREQEINFYRIIQEGINNILKHSGARQASVMIRLADGGMTASLWDNGKGFETEAVMSGLGLIGLRERAKIMHGTCEIRSTPGEGTTVFINIPKRTT